VVTVGLTDVVPVYGFGTAVVPVIPPVAVQVVAFVTFHDNVEALPVVIAEGFTEIDTTGFGGVGVGGIGVGVGGIGVGVGGGTTLFESLLCITHPSGAVSKSTCHQVNPDAAAGPATIIPAAFVGCVPKIVVLSDSLFLTLTAAVVCTRSPIPNF